MTALASTGILLLHPNGAVYALPFWTARLAVRYRGPGPISYIVIGLSMLGGALPQLVRDFQWLAALGIALGVLALVLLTANRQGREERLEQAELLVARRQHRAAVTSTCCAIAATCSS